MNNIQIAELISKECKQKNIKISELLQNCNINHSFISDIRHKNRAPSVDKISVIADYLNVSVDYLLGRTDTPNLLGNSDSNSGIINHNSLVNNSSQTINSNKVATDETAIQLLEAFQKLDIFGKAEVMNLVAKLSQKAG